MFYRPLFALIFLFSTLFSPVRADELTAEKKADIERLLEMTAATSVGRQMGAAIVTEFSQAIKQLRPDIPQRAIDALPREVMAVLDANLPALREVMIPIYHKHFSGPEVKQLIEFYSTELGQKTIKVMPSVVQDAMVAGQKWGQTLVPQIQQRLRGALKREGIDI